MRCVIQLRKYFFFFFLLNSSVTFAASTASTDTSFIVGVGVHLSQKQGDPHQTITMMQGANILSFRDDVPWSEIEKKKGQLRFPESLKPLETAVNLAVAKGMQPLLILDYGNKLYGGGYPVTDEARAGFVRYSEFIVNYFKGRVRYYEVWNEWNSKGLPQDYARLLKDVYPAIKRVDPSIVVLAGSVEGAGKMDYIETLMRQDIINFMDGFSVHPYVFWQGPQAGNPEKLMSWIQKLQNEILQKANSGKPIPIYITEIGWPTNLDHLGIESPRVADYLARTLLMMRTLPYVRGTWWYDLRSAADDDSKNRMNSFGIMSSRYEPKPAYESMRQVATLVGNAQFVERVQTKNDVWMLRFRQADGSEVLASWKSKGEERFEVSFDKSDDIAAVSGPAVKRVKGLAAKREQAPDVEQGKDSRSKRLTINESPLIVHDSKPLEVKSVTKIQ